MRTLNNLQTAGSTEVERASNRKVLRLIGGALLAAFALGVLANLQDIKRYIKISTM